MTSVAEFDDRGRLQSTVYGDVYCSGDGVAETEHVFVDGNDLRTRFAGVRDSFVIGETGFGAGLNFLVAAQRFAELAPAAARMQFVSTELHPLDAATLARAHEQLPAELHERAAQVRAQWGRQEDVAASFDGARIELLVLLGDAGRRLSGWDLAADAWFLDGFAPSCNPAMWSPALLGGIARRTVRSGTFATYTVAGDVRRALQAAGFVVERSQGFANKRHMLRGRLS